MIARTTKPAPVRYGFALLVTSLAALGGLVFRHPIMTLSPFLLFYAAVAVSSWFGGTGPGLLAVALGSCLTALLLLSPNGSFRVGAAEGTARLTLFLVVGALIACLNGALRRANERCEEEAAAARKNEARAKRLAEANLIGVFFSDIHGKISWANSELLRLLDKTQQELEVGNVNWQDVTVPDHRERDRHAMDELNRCGVCEPYEKEHLLSSDRRVPVLVGCAMLDPPSREIVGFVLDLTERKRAEAEIRRQQQRLQQMSSELMMAEERERRRIATVLHDAVVQMLALSKMKVDSLRREHAHNGMSQRLDEVYELIDRSIVHTRTLTAELSPPVLYELGLAAAIRWLGDRLREEHSLAFTLLDDGKPKPITDETRIVLFQAVRELTMNVVKHARATRCEVAIRRVDSQLEIVVSDNGKGFAQMESRDYTSGGFGLFSIRQRLNYLGGRLEVRSEAGSGSAAVIRTPLAIAERT